MSVTSAFAAAHDREIDPVVPKIVQEKTVAICVLAAFFVVNSCVPDDELTPSPAVEKRDFVPAHVCAAAMDRKFG